MATIDLLHKFRSTYEGTGFSGDCFHFAYAFNQFLGGVGTYVAATNAYLNAQGVDFYGHVALKVNGVLYDFDGVIDEEDLLAWGMLDPDEAKDIYNCTDEDCEIAELVELDAHTICQWATQ